VKGYKLRWFKHPQTVN